MVGFPWSFVSFRGGLPPQSTTLKNLLICNFRVWVNKPHTTDFPQKVAFWKGTPRLFQGNRAVGEILFHLARTMSFHYLSFTLALWRLPRVCRIKSPHLSMKPTPERFCKKKCKLAMKRVDAVPAKDLTVGWMCCQRGETAKNGRPSSCECLPTRKEICGTESGDWMAWSPPIFSKMQPKSCLI